MSNIAETFKQKLRWTRIHQKKIATRLINYRANRAVELKADEKSNHEYICFDNKDKSLQYKDMIDHIYINIIPGHRFQTWIDTGIYVVNMAQVIDNVAPDYKWIIDYSINDLIQLYGSFQKTQSNTTIINVLKYSKNYINRICSVVDKSIKENPNDQYLHNTRQYYSNMIDKRAASLEEALQRILFWSSLCWQSGMTLVGLGRLDKALDRFASPHDYSDEELNVAIDFLKSMHRYYAIKSGEVSLGDTGQIIFCGGLESSGEYFCNSITYLFIDAVKDAHLPDPKTCLRVSLNMPHDLLRKGLECISTGIGSPLLANDEVIPKALQSFGYEIQDAFNYISSACWEPLAYGRSLEKNNLKDINYAKALIDTYNDEEFDKCKSIDDILRIYDSKLTSQLHSIMNYLDHINWEPNPLLSLFTLNCGEQGKDLCEGGAKYNDYGILTVGLANTVDSLFNIEDLVFMNHKYALKDLRDAAIDDFKSDDNIKKDLSDKSYYALNNSEVISMVKRITAIVERECADYRNKFGGKLKWGLSSSNYAEEGKKTRATLDGRVSGKPLGVHISNSKAESYTELVEFASQLDYSGHKSNGNVIDFFVSPNLIKNNQDKFLQFIKICIKMGFFQMQMNVVDCETLKDAMIHPENHKDLIVRVWGFSAYFNDLPDYYKNLLISRAEESEKVA